jgi:putative membrane protein
MITIGQSRRFDMWRYDGDRDLGAWLAMAAGMLASWGLLLWAILALVRDSAGDGARRRSTPEQILAERFARGGVDEEDYRRRLNALHGSRTSRLVPKGDRS